MSRIFISAVSSVLATEAKCQKIRNPEDWINQLISILFHASDLKSLMTKPFVKIRSRQRSRSYFLLAHYSLLMGWSSFGAVGRSVCMLPCTCSQSAWLLVLSFSRRVEKKNKTQKKQQKSSVSLLAEVCSSRAAVLVYDPEGL